jgi:hypothetical protein
MGEKIALGTAVASSGVAIVGEPVSIEEQISVLQRQVKELMSAFHTVNSLRIKDKRQQAEYDNPGLANANKDGIPIGTSLVGTSVKGGIHVLTVAMDAYYIGITKFDSLSAAAEAASGIRRSGWTFWKMSDGRTIKEVFGKR